MKTDSVIRDRVAAAVNLISGTTAAAVLYTFSVVLYCLSARLSYPQIRNSNGKIKRGTILTLTLASVMMICATMDVVLSNMERQITYVDYGAFPSGPLGLSAGRHAATVTRVRLFVHLLENLLILGVLVWRVLVLWSGTPFLKPITLALYVVNTGLAITLYVSEYLISAQIPSSLAVPRTVAIIFIVAITFDTACLLLMTLMLVIRLLSVRWQHIEVMGKSEMADQYLGIVAILIESYVLETVWNIAFCIFCALQYAPVDTFFDATIIQVGVLTNLLVIYRVASGRAWDRQTHDRISTMRYNRNAQPVLTTGALDSDP